MEFMILAFDALKERKVRSAFTILMVLVGVALIVSVDAIGAGTKVAIEGEFEKFNTNLISVQPSRTHPEITERDLQKIREMDGVVKVVPYLTFAGQIESTGVSKDAVIMAIDTSELPILFPGLKMEDGELISPTDTVGTVLGYYIAHDPDGSLFATTGSVVKITMIDYSGQQQTVKTKNMVVRGVLETMGSISGFLFDQMAFISLRLAKQLFDKDTYNGVFVLVSDDDIVLNVSEKIADELDLVTISPKEVKEVVDRVMTTITVFVFSISTISLMVAAIGIITTLYTSMLERIREIGVLKAIGFKNMHILRMFLYEALLIGIIGSIIGTTAGVVGAYLMKNLFFSELPFLEPVFTPEVIIRANLMALSLSVVAGLYPAWRASKLDPIVALRHE